MACSHKKLWRCRTMGVHLGMNFLVTDGAKREAWGAAHDAICVHAARDTCSAGQRLGSLHAHWVERHRCVGRTAFVMLLLLLRCLLHRSENLHVCLAMLCL